MNDDFSNKNWSGSLTRRSFIKGTSTVVGVSSLGLLPASNVIGS
ncbi:twin-arginine translocation signal domain-containing protein, partial [Vibrio harveyi]